MRAGLRPYDGPPKFVVAFDIGTTYSAVSYSVLEPHRVPEILSVARFPAQGVARSDDRIPSLLYYDKAGIARAAGAEVLAADVIQAALSKGWTKAEWWKLHLCPKQLLGCGLPPLPPGKSAIDVLTDFIKFPWLSVEHAIDYTLTYPSGWGEVEVLYRLAIERAGLVPRTPEGRARVHMLSEGEAGLHFCIQHYLGGKIDKQTALQGVAVIDAGGGTVDLSMFAMVSCKWKGVVPAECQLQGSVFVTRRAEILLQRKLEGWECSSFEDIARFAREFDQTTKLVIKNDHEPAYVKVAGRRTNSSRYCILSGHLKLLGEEATHLFNDSINATIEAFEKQLRSTTTPITTVFLVGGLSNNDWFWSRLQSYFNVRNIDIYRPDSHLTKAVAVGAVLPQLAMVIPATMKPDSEERLKGNPAGPDVQTVQPRCPTCKSAAVGARNLVVLIDGRSNNPGSERTNVVKLFNALSDEGPECRQLIHYLKEMTSSGFEMPLARNAERSVKDAYDWLSRTYNEGDQIYLFGFSRGAYQVRALAAMVHEVGLVRERSEELIEHAYCLYLSIDCNNPITKKPAMEFKKGFCWPGARIHFVGVWDTTSSLSLIENDDHVAASGSVTDVCHFRHALALDERRVKFMPGYFLEANAYGNGAQTPRRGASDVKDVWFAGCYSDVGASRSYAGAASSPAKYLYPIHASNVPFLWMSEEAAAHGLLFKACNSAQYLEDADLDQKSAKNPLWKILDFIPTRHQVSFCGAGKHKWRWYPTCPSSVVPSQQIYSSVLSGDVYIYQGKDKKLNRFPGCRNKHDYSQLPPEKYLL